MPTLVGGLHECSRYSEEGRWGPGQADRLPPALGRWSAGRKDGIPGKGQKEALEGSPLQTEVDQEVSRIGQCFPTFNFMTLTEAGTNSVGYMEATSLLS